MRAVVQRVTSAEVRTGGSVAGAIGPGLLVLLGVRGTDTPELATKLAAKVTALRIFPDDAGRMNLSVEVVGGSILCVSQFTLYADVRRGNRPSFVEAANGEIARPLYETFCSEVERAGIRCERGVFGADMQVRLENDGPVTIIIDSDDLEAPRR